MIIKFTDGTMAEIKSDKIETHEKIKLINSILDSSNKSWNDIERITWQKK